MIERLEQRRHLSATLTGNVLTIVGTTRSDDIAIAAGRETFVVHDNGTQTAFNTRQVRTIRIFGLAGDDSIIVSPRLGIRCSIEAGPGHDRVGGGVGNDTIFGGRGEDTLVGNRGNDYLDAGPDDDLLIDDSTVDYDFTFAERNTFHGGGGSDTGRFFRWQENFQSGIENIEAASPDLLYPTSVTIDVADNRLVLQLNWYKPSGDDWEFAGPAAGLDGVPTITRAVEYQRISSDDFPYNSTFDITGAAATGLIFVNVAGDKISRVPIFLPTS